MEYLAVYFSLFIPSSEYGVFSLTMKSRAATFKKKCIAFQHDYILDYYKFTQKPDCLLVELIALVQI